MTPIACVGFYHCIHPDLVSKDIVTGALRAKDCSDQRKDDDAKCGMEGRLWTPRIPWWVKLADRVGMSNIRIGKT